MDVKTLRDDIQEVEKEDLMEEVQEAWAEVDKRLRAVEDGQQKAYKTLCLVRQRMDTIELIRQLLKPYKSTAVLKLTPGSQRALEKILHPVTRHGGIY